MTGLTIFFTSMRLSELPKINSEVVHPEILNNTELKNVSVMNVIMSTYVWANHRGQDGRVDGRVFR